MAKFVLDSEKLEVALANIVARANTRKERFENMAGRYKALEYTGGSADTVLDVLKQYEAKSNELVETEQDVVNFIENNIEIGEQIMKAAYLQNRVDSKVSVAAGITKKQVSMNQIKL